MYSIHAEWLRPLLFALVAGLPAILLTAVSIAMLNAQSEHSFFSWDNFAFRQTVWLGLGVCAAVVIAQLNFRVLLRYALIIYAVAVALSVIVALTGDAIHGHASWFSFGSVLFQPSGLLKIGLILVLARFYAMTVTLKHSTTVLLVGLLFFAFAAGSVFLQREFGSVVVLFGIWALLTFTRGLSFKQWMAGLIGLLIVASVSWMFVLKPYQKERVFTFMDPTRSQQDSGYNVRQSLIAIGSGGLFGWGLGNGPQTQLRYLPVRQTDFIYAAIGEELGFVGCIVVLLLEVWILLSVLFLAIRIRDDTPAYVLLGIFAVFFTHIAINIGMNIGLVPVTGIPLPFVSYGGSDLLISFVMIGIVANIMYQEQYRSLGQVSPHAVIEHMTPA